MQRVQLVLVVALLRADALSTLKPHRQIAQRLGLSRYKVQRAQFALDLAHDDAQNCALAFDHFAHAPELLGMGVATGAPTQRFAFFGERLFEANACALSHADHLLTGDLQQAAVHRVRNGFYMSWALRISPVRF